MLVAFDFDGTLSESEMTVLLGDQVDAADQMADITERAMNDEIGYAESLRRRCALLEGLGLDRANEAFEQVALRPDAAAILEELQDAGVYTAILTGGFERGVAAALARDDATVDTIIANRLPATTGALTGEVAGPLIEGTKDDALEVLQATVGEEETVAVGDGANDLPMLEAADLAIGFEPKPAVEPSCDIVVSTMSELREVFQDKDIL